MYEIRALAPEQLEEHVASFVALLQDAVDSGASVGFVPPLDRDEARRYWNGVRAALGSDDNVAGESGVGRSAGRGHRVLLAAVEDGRILGSVQLDLAAQLNARHRAEVMKLMVHRDARRRGIGRALMLALEDAARREGRTLLVLDTRVGDTAEQMYLGLGYIRAGVIPRYALSAAGTLDATVYMYRELER